MSAPQSLVSVVMTSYNYARFLDESIGSVASQTYRALEIVVVDDRSSDHSWEIIQRWAAGDSRIRGILTSERLGFVGALNVGVTQARGEFVAIIDSDDVWLPQRIEKQVAVMTHPANAEVGVCGSNCLLIDGEGNVTGTKEFPVADEGCRRALWYRNPFCHSATLIRRACFDRYGLYDPEFQMVQDLDLWFRIGQGFKFFNVPEYLAKYRISGHNASVQRQRRLISTTLAVRRAAVKKHGYRMGLGGRLALAGAWCMKWLPTPLVHLLFHRLFLRGFSFLWESRARGNAADGAVRRKFEGAVTEAVHQPDTQ